MGLQRSGTVERILQKLLVPIWAITGIVVVVGFFFPGIVGSVVSGQGWLVVSLLFFVSGLTYLAVLPGDNESDGSDTGSRSILNVRRLDVVKTLGGVLSRQDRITFSVPVAALIAFFTTQALFPDLTVSAVTNLQRVVTTTFGWIFVAVVLLSVLFCLYLLVGPWGDVTLGGADVEPTYTYPVYFTMVFTAGIAAGIVFWGPAEALFHYQRPPPFYDVAPQSEAAITAALAYALFHWGFSAWSAYIAIGVPIAYFVYQRGAPLRVSAILVPFIGVSRMDSRWCRFVDLLAIFATIGGIATSVALVSQQFLTGIQFQWAVSFDTLGSVLFVSGLTLVFVVSAQSGVHRGIRRIAAVNVSLFVLFAVLLFAVSPQRFVFDRGAAAIGQYAVDFLPMSVYFGERWVADWTIWNWAWWFSWAPFAGVFLAALSRGRRIRTVVFTGFVATSLATIVWFLLLGSTSLHLQHTGTVDVLGAIDAYGGSEAVAGFPMFEALPISQLLMFLFLALIIVFMTTSADTSTLVVAVLATKRGRAPTTGTIVFWGVVQGGVAIMVILTGSTEVLQAIAVLVGGPFAIVAVVAMLGFLKWFRAHERGHASVLDAIRSFLEPHDWEKND
ncbi:MAG: BCCT family transporter [Halobacteriota archaeon]